MTTSLLDVNGATIEVDIEGSGPTVLCCNGTGATIASSKVLFDPLRRHCTVISFNARGMGRSSAPAGPWTMADYARDCVGIFDVLGVASAAVFGISFGGMVALEFAVTYPERVERLALWATSAGGNLGSSYPLHTLASASPLEQAAMAPLLLDSRFTPQWLDEHPSDAALVNFRRQANDAATTDEARRIATLQLDARAHHDVAARLDQVTAPTLVGVGSFDLMAPPPNGAALADAISDAVLVTYEGGHLFFVQDPRALPDLCAFLTTGARR